MWNKVKLSSRQNVYETSEKLRQGVDPALLKGGRVRIKPEQRGIENITWIKV